MSGLLNINIFVEKEIPQIPGDIPSLDASNTEDTVIDISRYYSEKYQIHPSLKIYYVQNPSIVQIARDIIADQRLKFVYKKDKEKWLFVSAEKIFLKFEIV